MRLLIHTAFFHPSVGGVETFVDGLAGELTRLGLGVTVFAETPLGPQPEIARPYRIVRAGSMRRRDALAECDVLLSKGPATRMLPLARRMGIPFVLAHSAPVATCPIGIGWRQGASCQYSLRKCLGCGVSGRSTLGNAASMGRRAVLKWAMLRAAENVYVSEFLAERAGRPGRVIGNFCDPAIFHPGPGLPPEPAFLFVGRLVPIKGLDVAIRGFAIARRRGLNDRLRIIGDGPERETLERLASAEGVADAVDFLGVLRGNALADRYREARALLVPTQAEESFGIVMAEAMACGCPVIASDRGACPEVVGDAGIPVAPGEPDRWADAMLELAGDPARRTELSRLATGRAAERYTIRSVALKYLDVLESAARP